MIQFETDISGPLFTHDQKSTHKSIADHNVVNLIAHTLPVSLNPADRLCDRTIYVTTSEKAVELPLSSRHSDHSS